MAVKQYTPVFAVGFVQQRSSGAILVAVIPFKSNAFQKHGGASCYRSCLGSYALPWFDAEALPHQIFNTALGRSWANSTDNAFYNAYVAKNWPTTGSTPLATAKFARDHSKFSRENDFSISFGAYFQQGLRFTGSSYMGQSTGWGNVVNHISEEMLDFFDTLS